MQLLAKKEAPVGAYFLFLCLLVYSLLLAPLAILGELDLALHEFFILARPIVNALAVLAREFNELFLGHMWGVI